MTAAAMVRKHSPVAAPSTSSSKRRELRQRYVPFCHVSCRGGSSSGACHGGDLALPINAIVTREVELRGGFRFDEEFDLAVELINRGRVDVKPLVTASLPITEAVTAFELASDRSRSVKVQLEFS